jgi:hypothetical protein
MATSQARQTEQFQNSLQIYRNMFRQSSETYLQAARGLRDYELNHRHLWGQFYDSFDEMLRRERLGITPRTYREHVRLFDGEFAGIHPEIFAVCGVHGANQASSLSSSEQPELLSRARAYHAEFHHPPTYQWMVRQIREIRGIPREDEVTYLIRMIHVCIQRLDRGGVARRTVAQTVLPHLRATVTALTDLLEARRLNSTLPERKGC